METAVEEGLAVGYQRSAISCRLLGSEDQAVSPLLQQNRKIGNDTLVHMVEQKRITVIGLPELSWPASLQLPSSRFRLFVAADSRDSSVQAVSKFALAALRQGMVYCCVWGPGCERFHDIVDETVVEEDINECRFVGMTPKDVIITTWHIDETLEEALEFFTTSALPSEGLIPNSDFRLVACVGHPEWTVTASSVLQSTRSSE